jgi:hypothetical protein
VIRTFSSEKDALSFANSLPGKFYKKHDSSKSKSFLCTENLKKSPCPSKYLVSEEKCGDEISYSIRGCVVHNHEVVEPVVVGKKEFASREEAFDFIIDNEIDSTFRFRYMLSPEKANTNYMYFQCRRAAQYTAKKKSKKCGCKAFFTLKQYENGTVSFQGNFDHIHPKDDLMVISSKQRTELIEWLREGLTINKCKDRLVDRDPSLQTKGKQVLIDDIRMIQRHYAPGSIDLKISERDNVYRICGDEGIRKFNFRGIYTGADPPDSIVHKEIMSDEPVVVYMSDEHRKIFREHPESLAGDSTHDTNRAGLLLGSLMVFNDQGEGVSIMQSLFPTESAKNVKWMFETLFELEPEAFMKITSLTTDMNNAWKNALNSVMDRDVKFIKCSWHVDEAWQKHMDEDMFHEIRDTLRLEGTENQFHIQYSLLQEKYRKRGTEAQKKAWEYFVDNYGYQGIKAKPVEWARCFNSGSQAHNLYLERRHKGYKSKFVFPFYRVDQCLDGLMRYNRHVTYDEAAKMRVMRNIRPSNAQTRYRDSHREANGFKITVLPLGGFLLQETGRELGKDFLLTLNDRHQCNLTTCLVSCQKCPAGPNLNCAHAFRCTCRRYAKENQCEHLHLRNILVNGNDADTPIELEPVASRSTQNGTQFPKTISKRTHSFGYAFARKQKRRKPPKGKSNWEDWGLERLLDQMVDEDVEEYEWGFIVCSDSKTFMQAVAKLGKEKQETALVKFELAKLRWKCNGCFELDIQKARSEYIQCDSCDLWYHGACTDRDLSDESLADIDWFCKDCHAPTQN